MACQSAANPSHCWLAGSASGAARTASCNPFDYQCSALCNDVGLAVRFDGHVEWVLLLIMHPPWASSEWMTNEEVEGNPSWTTSKLDSTDWY